MAQHTLSVLVENSPGVLARVASLFSVVATTLILLLWVQPKTPLFLA